MTWEIVVGDCRESLRAMPAGTVQTCVTSPPYFGLRDYGTGEWEGGDPSCDHKGQPAASATASTLKNDGRPREQVGQNNYERQAGAVYRDVCGKCGARRVDGQIGLEPTPDEFVQALVQVFREVRRVLRDDGTVWLNLGDSYNADGRKGRAHMGEGKNNGYSAWVNKTMEGTKPKDLLGIPWMVAFALRADGWYLRSDIIWSKPNPMPESVTDRPTKAHEYLFLLSKGPRYFYDADAIREPHADDWHDRASTWRNGDAKQQQRGATYHPFKEARPFENPPNPAGRNRRSVWTVATQPYAGAHFATFPPKLIEPCVLAGSSPKACGVCGAPWRRVTQGHGPDKPNDHERHASAPQRIGGLQRGLAKAQVGSTWTKETVGWEPTCECGDTGRRNTFTPAATVSCIVLDPFAGSGTTGVVAGWHGRDFIGLELNPEYAAMAQERIALEGRPGGRPAHHEPVRVVADQLGLLDALG